MTEYVPEGYIKRDNYKYTIEEIEAAIANNKTLEGIVVKSDKDYNLHVNLGDITGILSKEEFEYSNKEVNKSDIISKVGDIVMFKVTNIRKQGESLVANLSRRAVQEECHSNMIKHLEIGRILKVKVLRAEKYGIFCDIGCGIKALLPVKNFCINRIQDIASELKCTSLLAIVDNIDENGRITLSHKELLGTWCQEASKFTVGDTVIGTVRSNEKYGTFIEISPNITGLAKTSTQVKHGDRVVVKIKKIKVEQLKVVVSIVRVLENETNSYTEFKYTEKQGIIKNWRYTM